MNNKETIEKPAFAIFEFRFGYTHLKLIEVLILDKFKNVRQQQQLNK